MGQHSFPFKVQLSKADKQFDLLVSKNGGKSLKKVFETILLLPPTTLMVQFFHKLLSRKSLAKKKSTLFMVRMIHFQARKANLASQMQEADTLLYLKKLWFFPLHHITNRVFFSSYKLGCGWIVSSVRNCSLIDFQTMIVLNRVVVNTKIFLIDEVLKSPKY